MLALNVSCPDCGKRFENIKPELAGKKAKCSCGRVLRLGTKALAPRNPSRDRNPPDPEDLMSVDLLGDELLGDQLLGGQFLDDLESESKAPPVETAKPKSKLKSSATVPINNAQPKSPNKARQKVKKDVPVIKVSQSPTKSRRTKRPAKNTDKPIFADTYSDLDSILDGVGDAAPIVVRPDAAPATPQIENPDDQDSPGKSGSANKRAAVGLIAALMSATLAFWFGVFAVVSRFEVVDQMMIGGFSATLNSVYLASFGDTEIPAGLQSMFVGLGWCFWIVALFLMVFGVVQFFNAFFKLIFGRHLMGWSDGVTAGLGVAALFLAVCLIFTQTSLQRHQHKFFDDYEKSAMVEGGHLENVVVIRNEFDEQQSVVRHWLIVSAVVPCSVFGLSIVRLFTSMNEK